MRNIRGHRIILLIFTILCCLLIGAACGEETAKPNKNTATITYDTGVEGLEIPSLVSKIGGKIYPPEDPVRDGYRFDGWSLNGEPYSFDVMPDQDITLKALWTKYYTLSFDVGEDVAALPSLQLTAGEEIPLPKNPTRDHYLFESWTLNGVPFLGGTMPSEDITLRAEWKKAVMISFVTGTSDYFVSPILAPAGEEISAPKVNRPGYHLNAWKTIGGAVYDFTYMPDEDLTLYADWMELTSLPALFIDLYDESGNQYPLSSVGKESYVQSVVSIENTEDPYLLDAVKAEFKGRGNGSWNDIPYDKKGYKIKFDKKQSLFGREANKHWVIIACVSSQFPETTMSRNYLAYNMADELFDGIEYTTTAQWIDVYVNNEYRGVYLLCEHVRVGSGRVDIESDFLGTGSDYASTGYLIEYDKYAAESAGEEGVEYFRIDGVKYPFTVHSPDPEDLREGKAEVTTAEYMQQIAYIKQYVQRVYSAALAPSVDWTTFSELADVDSFVDMYILHEYFKNTDTGYSSFYLYKKPNGKLYAGPAWDFDATCNATRGNRTPQGIYVADSVRTESGDTASELYISLYRNYYFKKAVTDRWKVLSPKIKAFLDERLNDEVYDAVKGAMGKNYSKWLNTSQEAAEAQWVTDIKTLKKWLIDRAAWLDNEWK